MTLPQLQLINPEANGFRAAQATSDKQAQKRRVPLPSQRVLIGGVKQLLGLVACQPIAEPPAKLSDSFDPSDSCRQLGAQPTALTRLVGQSADRREMKIYRGARKCQTLTERAISDYGTT